MTRSIFDPEGGETEHSGSRNLGPLAENNSHMPPDVVDGKVSEEEAAEQEQAENPLQDIADAVTEADEKHADENTEATP